MIVGEKLSLTLYPGILRKFGQPLIASLGGSFCIFTQWSAIADIPDMSGSAICSEKSLVLIH